MLHDEMPELSQKLNQTVPGINPQQARAELIQGLLTQLTEAIEFGKMRLAADSERSERQKWQGAIDSRSIAFTDAKACFEKNEPDSGEANVFYHK